MIIREDPHWRHIGATDESARAQWNWIEDKVFEQALADIPDDVPHRWEMIALYLPGKTANDVAMRYHGLARNVREIDAGQVELPSYAKDSTVSPQEGRDSSRDLAVIHHDSGRDSSANKNLFEGAEPERKKGTPWTVEEHKLFLKGLQLYGKGDWKSIARNVVLTRTPTQVASHAQKYFLRQASAGKKERKRASIHDINTVDLDWLSAPSSVDEEDFIQPHSANYQPPDKQMLISMNQPQPLRFIPNQEDALGSQTYYSNPVPVPQFDDQKNFFQPHDQQLPMWMNQPQLLRFIPNQGNQLGFQPYDSDLVPAALSDDQKNFIQPPAANLAASSADVNIADVPQPLSFIPNEGGPLGYHIYDSHPVSMPPFDYQTNFIQPPAANPAASSADVNIVDVPQPLTFISN